MEKEQPCKEELQEEIKDEVVNEEDCCKESQQQEELEQQEEIIESEKLIQLEESLKQCTDKYQRLMAEFDNFRKRTQKEKLDTYDNAICDTVLQLLPIVDNFERALQQECNDSSFLEGIQMIYKQFMGAFEHLQVMPIDAKDQTFDPNLHNAILHIEDESYEENVVVEELQKGYVYKDKVIRYSMVKVAN